MGFPAMSVAQAHGLLTAPGSPLETTTATINGQQYRVFKNAPNAISDILRLSKMHGDAEFLVLDDERITYRAHYNATAKLAHLLQSQFGIQKGDRVALVMRNLPEWPAIFFATLSIGAIICPLNAWWTAEELDYGLRDCGAKLAFLDGERAARMAAITGPIDSLEHVVVARSKGAGPDGAVAFEDLLGHPTSWADLPETELPAVAINTDDLATLYYTSGTTGKPKGAFGTHRNCTTNLMNMMVNVARQHLRRGEAPPTPDPTAPKKNVLLSIPFFHVTGSHAVLVPSVAQGVKIVMMKRWDALEGLKLIEREKINSFGGVPAIAWQILEHPQLGEFDTTSVESVSYGGAPSSAELVRRIKEAFPNSGQPGQGYGLSETSAAVTQIAAEDYLLRPTSCGPVHPVCDVRIVDADGRDVPTGEIGEIWIRGPNVVMGYWNKPEATEAAFGGGWFKSGDLGKLDEEGFLFILDRAKDMIIRGGENVYCVEIEDILYKHPDISDAAIVGVPHKVLGEEVGAVVTVPSDSAITDEEIRDWVRQHLAGFKVPVHIRIFHEPLPRNANGKILKRDLKVLFEESVTA
jgi:long-chain acyl-CoA synthetase